LKLTMLSRDDRVVRLACEGGLTLPDLDGVGDPFDRTLKSDDFRRTVLVDLGRSNYLNSSGISWLLESDRRFRRQGGRLVLHSLAPHVSQVARLTRLDSLLHVTDDERAAHELACSDV
jgi:anti-anti-sigma factor